MKSVVVSEGRFSDLLEASRTGSVVYLGEFPYSSWGVDLEGDVFIIQHDTKVYQIDEAGELQLSSQPLPRLGESFQAQGRNYIRRGMAFSVFYDDCEISLGLHECSDWHPCRHGIAYVNGDKFHILVVRDE